MGIFNYCPSEDLNDWLPPSTIMIIKEPWLRYGSLSKVPMLRIDSPTDIIFVDSTDIELLKKIGAEKW